MKARAATLIATLGLLAHATLSATTVRVPADEPTIQAGIDATGEGDTVLVAPGTYSGPGNYDLSFHGVDRVLMSSGGLDQTVLDGGYVSYRRFIAVGDGESTASVMEGFTVTLFLGDGAIGCYGGSSPTLSDLRIHHCYDGNFDAVGAGIICIDSSPALMDVALESNYCEGGGAGMYCSGSSAPSLMRVLFRDNGCIAGGAGLKIGPGCGATFSDVVFEGNEAYSGGALWVGTSIPLDLSGTVVVGNRATERGGALTLDGGAATLAHCTLVGNLTAGEASGIYAGDGAALAIGACIVVLGDGGAVLTWEARAPSPASPARTSSASRARTTAARCRTRPA